MNMIASRRYFTWDCSILHQDMPSTFRQLLRWALHPIGFVIQHHWLHHGKHSIRSVFEWSIQTLWNSLCWCVHNAWVGWRTRSQWQHSGGVFERILYLLLKNTLENQELRTSLVFRVFTDRCSQKKKDSKNISLLQWISHYMNMGKMKKCAGNCQKIGASLTIAHKSATKTAILKQLISIFCCLQWTKHEKNCSVLEINVAVLFYRSAVKVLGRVSSLSSIVFIMTHEHEALPMTHFYSVVYIHTYTVFD